MSSFTPGVYFGVRELLRSEARLKQFGIKNLKMEDQRIVVQGFGNGVYLWCAVMVAHRAAVGYYASHFFSKQGAKVICVVEHDGYVYNSKGLDVEALNKVRCWLSKLAVTRCTAQERDQVDPALPRRRGDAGRQRHQGPRV